MRANKKTTRNDEIIRRYLLPTSIGVLAKDFGLSRQRISQITGKSGMHRPKIDMKVPGSISQTNKETARAIANGSRPDWRRPPGGKSLDIIAMRENGKPTYATIATELGVEISTVANALKRWRPDLLRGPRHNGK